MSISVHVSVMLEPCERTKCGQKGQTNRGVKQMLEHTWGKARKKLFQLANNLFLKKFQAASTFYTSPHSHIKSEQEEGTQSPAFPAPSLRGL